MNTDGGRPANVKLEDNNAPERHTGLQDLLVARIDRQIFLVSRELLPDLGTRKKN